MSATVCILGNTGTDAKLDKTDQGTPVATFSIAANSARNTAEGREKRTDWFNVTAYGKIAETLAANLKKGEFILVRGRLTFNPWLSRDNEPRVSADVVLQDFEFVGVGSESVGPEPSMEESLGATPVTTPSGVVEDEPFVDQF